ncbi:F420-dependent NADP reductase [Ornatilinea apprima]|uniref:F420-dependent NADP reductase n=1 Tax=Ornatilinea apprima TaxID=1134406 RepID=A0A0P6XY36_9CHLR|nr:NADPH-dependent F420 reductase [Ornatilinea apprima]KPL81015.1 F420-dependent NADP reductase [Ornatilinea apprima]
MKDPILDNIKTISIIGGTGKEGKGLAYRWAKAGYQIIIGSRSNEKAETAAAAVRELLDGVGVVVGKENAAAAQEGDIVVLTVPFAAHVSMLEYLKPYLQGKTLIDVTVPLVPPKVTRVQMPPAGSAGLEAQQVLGEGVAVVTAFQNISYENLLEGEDVDCDILVCGSSKEARETVLALVKEAGLIGWDAGPLENSVVVEGLTSILIGINKRYGVTSSGIRITGVPLK